MMVVGKPDLKVEQSNSVGKVQKTEDIVRTHPKWQQWLWGYDAYEEVDKAGAVNLSPDELEKRGTQ